MSEANEKQVAGEHYKSKYQHWDWVLDLSLPYLPGQVSKYLYRWRKKNGLEDLEKSLHFLQKFIEQETHNQSDVRKATINFLTMNEVSTQEGEIVRCLVDFHMGSLDYLKAAENILKQLIADTKEA